MRTYPLIFQCYWSFYMQIQDSRSFAGTYLPRISRAACTNIINCFLNYFRFLVFFKFACRGRRIFACYGPAFILWLLLSFCYCIISTKGKNDPHKRLAYFKIISLTSVADLKFANTQFTLITFTFTSLEAVQKIRIHAEGVTILSTY